MPLTDVRTSTAEKDDENGPPTRSILNHLTIIGAEVQAVSASRIGFGSDFSKLEIVSAIWKVNISQSVLNVSGIDSLSLNWIGC
jgi:hypothetical protein